MEKYTEKFNNYVPQKIQDLVFSNNEENVRLALEIWDRDFLLDWFNLLDSGTDYLGIPYTRVWETCPLIRPIIGEKGYGEEELKTILNRHDLSRKV